MWLDDKLGEEPTPVRYFKFVDQGEDGRPVDKYYTSLDIMNTYFEHWREQMLKRFKPPEWITRANCIDDWKVVNWAEEISKEEYEKATQ